MADPSFPARYSTATDMLNNTTTNLFNQYTIAQTASGALTGQNTKLQAEVESLSAKLAHIKMAGDTYDREFLDRSAGKRNDGVLRRYGVSTLQDWLFFIFFISYAVITITFTAYVLDENGIGYAAISAIVSLIIGVMMSAVMMRFV